MNGTCSPMDQSLSYARLRGGMAYSHHGAYFRHGVYFRHRAFLHSVETTSGFVNACSCMQSQMG